jgi:hypothetical protein
MDFKNLSLGSLGEVLKPNYRNKMQVTFSTIEKAKGLLTNLDKLKAEKAIDDNKYFAMRKEYTTMLDKAQGELADLTKKINKGMMEKKKEIDQLTIQLKDLELRQKTGEITGDAYTSKNQEITSKIGALEQEIRDFESLAKAKSSADVGGFIDIQK